MKVQLDNSEILDAINAYAKDLGLPVEDKHVEVTLRAGRGGNGYTADIDITEEAPTTKKPKPKKAKAKTKRTPRAAEAEPAKVVEEAAEVVETAPVEETAEAEEAQDTPEAEAQLIPEEQPDWTPAAADSLFD